MRRFDWAWLVLLGIASSAWCLMAARELSATFDEPFYMRAGLESWRSGSNHELMRAGTMPLPVDVQYLPIYIWEQLRGEPFDTQKECHTILPYARATNLVFWWQLLIYGTLLARHVGGPWAGRFATLLIATEPSLLGHACMATTDISVTALIFACVYHFQTGRERGWVLRWLIPGLLFGLAMSAKVSAVTFVPLILGAFEIVRVIGEPPGPLNAMPGRSSSSASCSSSPIAAATGNHSIDGFPTRRNFRRMVASRRLCAGRPNILLSSQTRARRFITSSNTM